MDFCKEFNARTAQYNPGTPIPALVTVRPDRSFTFTLRTPPTSTLLLQAAGVNPVKNRLRGAGNSAGPKTLTALAAQTATVPQKSEEKEKVVAKAKDAKGKAGTKEMAGQASVGTVGTVSLKHVYEIARIKHTEDRLSGLSLEGLVKSVVAQAGSMGVVVVP